MHLNPLQIHIYNLHPQCHQEMEPLGSDKIMRTLSLWQGLCHMRSQKCHLWTRNWPPQGTQPAPSFWTSKFKNARRNKFFISEPSQNILSSMFPLILLWKNAGALDTVWIPASDVEVGAGLVTLWPWTSHLWLPHILCQDLWVVFPTSPCQTG